MTRQTIQAAPLPALANNTRALSLSKGCGTHLFRSEKENDGEAGPLPDFSPINRELPSVDYFAHWW
jgi:hypothetical protein